MASAILHAVICAFSAASNSHWLTISLRDIAYLGGALILLVHVQKDNNMWLV